MNDEHSLMGEFADVVERLIRWADKQNLVEEAMKGFAMWFEDAGGAIDGWTHSNIRPKFRAHSLCFTNTLLSYPYVTTALDLYTEDGWEIGTYRLITTLDGEIDDDYIEIDRSKTDYEQRKQSKSGKT